MSMEINRLDKRFLEILARDLEKYDEFWDEKVLRDEFESENSDYFVLVDGEDVYGFGGLWFNLDEAHVMNIAVRKDLRRNGYGSEFLKFLIDVANERGKGCVTLEVRENNLAAIGLYEKMGFVVAGRRSRYYENGMDALIMTKFF